MSGRDGTYDTSLDPISPDFDARHFGLIAQEPRPGTNPFPAHDGSFTDSLRAPAPHRPGLEARMTDNKVTATVRSLDEMIEKVPPLLGFTPEDSMVLVGLVEHGFEDRSGHVVGLTTRVDLPDMLLPGALPEIASVLKRNDIIAVIALVYGESTDDLERVVTHDLSEVGIEVWDYAVVTDRPATAPTRAEIEAELDRSDEERALYIADELMDDSPIDFNEPAVVAGLRMLAASDEILLPVEAALLIAGINDESNFTARDAILGDATQLTDQAWKNAAALWTDLVQHAPHELIAPAACILAGLHWVHGDGVRVNVALAAAEASRPGYRLAVLMGEALSRGVTPDEVKAMCSTLASL